MKLFPNPRAEKLRETYAMGCSVAKELLATKSKESNDDKGTRDIMSLFSKCFPRVYSTRLLPKLTTLIVRANASSAQASRLSEEEMISQILCV